MWFSLRGRLIEMIKKSGHMDFPASIQRFAGYNARPWWL
jgi:hypothetical protein